MLNSLDGVPPKLFTSNATRSPACNERSPTIFASSLSTIAAAGSIAPRSTPGSP